jgi:hypothetical protein
MKTQPHEKSLMKSGNIVFGLCVAVILTFGALSGFAQTNQYVYTGAETNITLDPGTYDITTYGAAGGGGLLSGGLGAEMEAQFTFTTSTNLTLLVGGMGTGSPANAGGGGGSFVLSSDGTPLIIAGGGGGSGRQLSGGIGTGGNGLTNSDGGNGSGGGAGGTAGNGGGSGGFGSGGGGIFSSGAAGTGGIVGGGIYNDSSGAGAYGGGFGGGGGGLTTGGPSPSYGSGGGGGYSGGGGSGNGPGGGGGSFIDSSAIQTGVQISGVRLGNGEIDIALVPTNSAVPALGICLVSNLPVVVWPASATNYTLQMSTNLASGVWVSATNGIPYIGLQITNPPPNAFFRLSQ